MKKKSIILRIILSVLFINTFQLSVNGGIPRLVGNQDNKDRVLRVRSVSVFPILMYDSDIGFGFGGKGIVKNWLHKNESFDLMLFGSTKGEQKYSFIFSMPDYEIRQGTLYAVALDLRMEYNKLLKSNFFGFGNSTKDNDFQFPREASKVELTLSRAFHEKLIGELGFRYTFFSVYGFDPEWETMMSGIPGAGENSISSFYTKFRYDTRDSQIHPSRGFKVEIQAELGIKLLNSDWNYQKVRVEFSMYRRLFSQKHILALRCWMQHVKGEAPYLELSKIGDGWTSRGYKAERFLDNAMALYSIEYRFPLLRKLGGVLFTDAGRVWPELWKFNFRDYHFNVGLGMRYYLANFVVRFDMGFSNEGSRMFFNFGHVF